MITDFQSFLGVFTGLIKAAIPVIASMTLLVFFWGLVKFISKAGDDKSIEDGKNLMIWGILALFVMVSIWGILAFMSDQFGFSKVVPLLPTR